MLSPLTFSKRIPKWVVLKSFISSLSCTNNVINNPEIDQTYQSLPNATGIEAKLQSLGNKLHPDSLVHVLDSTSDALSAIKIFKWASVQKNFKHTADTYYWMILKLGMAGNVKEMEGFVQNMVKDGCQGEEKALLSLLAAFVRHHKLDEAICVLVNVNLAGYRPSIDIFNLVLNALTEEKRGFQEVLFVYKEMVKAGVAPTVDTLNCLLEVLFETDRLDSALDQYRRMKKKGCCPNSRTFEIVIKSLIAQNKVDDSIVVLHEMLEQRCPPELSFYSFAIPLFCKEDILEEGLRLFRMMRASKFVPDSFTYEALVECLCKKHRLDDAVNLVEEMTESCLTPTNNVFMDIVNEFCVVGKTNEAMKFLEEKQVYETSPYNALLECYCNAGQFFVAKGLLEKMSQCNIADSKSWNILIRWLCEKMLMRRACEVLSRMIVLSLIPDCTSFSALVVGYCRLGKYDAALQLFLQLRAKGWILDPGSYAELIKCLCTVEKYLEAVEVFLYMSENKCSLHSHPFCKLIEGMCETGRVHAAVKLQLLAYNSGTSFASIDCNYIMLGLSTTDGGKNLLAFVSRMLIGGCNLDIEAYCILIQSMITQNKSKYCALFFNVMVNGGLVPDRSTLCDLLAFLASHSQLSLISTTVDRIVSDFNVLDSVMYSILVNGLWKEGNKNEAHRLLDLMLEKGWVPNAATHSLLIGCFEMEKAVKGKEIFELSIKDGVSDILAEGLGEI